jgi:lipopolysaccharide/colanic/teichoic acid biosynthesis glycosyltransferase
VEACPPDQAVQADGRWKRPFDLLIGSGATLVLLPVILLLALVIRLDSPGPVFFRQERVGRDGTTFRMWKFRSMRHKSADAVHREAAAAWFASRPTNGRYKSLGDPRITRVGRFIRRTSLDELPQLFNVLSGEMSLVGPRPAIPYELPHYAAWYFERQRVKPGMTGLWQVSGRESVSAADMMALDVRYVREHSLWLDFKILAHTVPALMGRPATHI